MLRSILGWLGDEGEDLSSYGWTPNDLSRILSQVSPSVPPVSSSFINGLLTPATSRKSDEQLESETGIRATLEPEDDARKAKPIRETPAQRETIDRTIQHMGDETEDPKLSDGRALELALADWLAGL